MSTQPTEKAALPLRPVAVSAALRAALEQQAARAGLSINELVTRYAAAAAATRQPDLRDIFETGDMVENAAITGLPVVDGRFGA